MKEKRERVTQQLSLAAYSGTQRRGRSGRCTRTQVGQRRGRGCGCGCGCATAKRCRTQNEMHSCADSGSSLPALGSVLGLQRVNGWPMCALLALRHSCGTQAARAPPPLCCALSGGAPLLSAQRLRCRVAAVHVPRAPQAARHDPRQTRGAQPRPALCCVCAAVAGSVTPLLCGAHAHLQHDLRGRSSDAGDRRRRAEDHFQRHRCTKQQQTTSLRKQNKTLSTGCERCRAPPKHRWNARRFGFSDLRWPSDQRRAHRWLRWRAPARPPTECTQILNQRVCERDTQTSRWTGRVRDRQRDIERHRET